MSTKRVGNVGEAATIAEFVYFGVPVYLPFGDNETCDLVADFDGKLQRVQVKTTSKITNGKITFSVGSRRYGSDHTYSESEVDYFVLYCIENRSTYLVKNEDGVNTREITLRVSPTRNGQTSGVKMADDYLFSNRFIAR